MAPSDKPLVWLYGEIKTPPFSAAARIEAGVLLRRLQRGELLGLPHSRPLPRIGRACHELRLIYQIRTDAIVILDIFNKATGQTPQSVVEVCKARLARYQALQRPGDKK